MRVANFVKSRLRRFCKRPFNFLILIFDIWFLISYLKEKRDLCEEPPLGANGVSDADTVAARVLVVPKITVICSCRITQPHCLNKIFCNAYITLNPIFLIPTQSWKEFEKLLKNCAHIICIIIIFI